MKQSNGKIKNLSRLGQLKRKISEPEDAVRLKHGETKHGEYESEDKKRLQ